MSASYPNFRDAVSIEVNQHGQVPRIHRFRKAEVLTYNANTLITPGLQTINAEAGDYCIFYRETPKLTVISSFIRGSIAPVTLTATATITAATHAGRTLLMGEVGGNALATFTLPAATGTGNRYKFIVSVVNTSNYVIKVADATDIMQGSVLSNSTGETPDLTSVWPTAGTSDTITLNGTTTGGVSIGDYIELEDILSNTWAVRGVTTSSGTIATPFSATVS